MPPQPPAQGFDFSKLPSDPTFQSMTPTQQALYLKAVSPDFAGMNAADQLGYLSHLHDVTGQQVQASMAKANPLLAGNVTMGPEKAPPLSMRISNALKPFMAHPIDAILNSHPIDAIANAMETAIPVAPSEEGTLRARTSDVVRNAGQLFDALAPEVLTLGGVPVSPEMMASDALAGKVGELSSLVASKIPSTARATELFKNVSSVAGKNPVTVTNDLSKALTDIQQAADTGSSMPQAARKLVLRLTNPDAGPLTYDEGRQFASNISRLSADEGMRLTPNMKRLLGNLRVALNGTVEQTAADAGKLTEYQQAMKNYRNAARAKDVASTVAKRYVIPGMEGYLGYRLLGDLLHRYTP